jgi:hypothetical protein
MPMTRDEDRAAGGRVDWQGLRTLFERYREGDDPDADEALLLDLAEERAAIMEYDGGLPREKAEALAFGNAPRPARTKASSRTSR